MTYPASPSHTFDVSVVIHTAAGHLETVCLNSFQVISLYGDSEVLTCLIQNAGFVSDFWQDNTSIRRESISSVFTTFWTLLVLDAAELQLL